MKLTILVTAIAMTSLIIAACGQKAAVKPQAEKKPASQTAAAKVPSAETEKKSEFKTEDNITNLYYTKIAAYFSGKNYNGGRRPYNTDDLKAPAGIVEPITNIKLSYLILLRNEIFARHGYAFETEYLRKTLSAASWYQVKTNFNILKDLNDIEKKNMDYVRKMEQIDTGEDDSIAIRDKEQIKIDTKTLSNNNPGIQSATAVSKTYNAARQLAILLTLPKEGLSTDEALKVYKATGKLNVLTKVNKKTEYYLDDLSKLGWQSQSGAFDLREAIELDSAASLVKSQKSKIQAYLNFILKMKEKDRFLLKNDDGKVFLVEDFAELPLSDNGEGKTIKKWKVRMPKENMTIQDNFWCDLYINNNILIDYYGTNLFVILTTNGEFITNIQHTKNTTNSNYFNRIFSEYLNLNYDNYSKGILNNWKMGKKELKINIYSEANNSFITVISNNGENIYYNYAIYRPDYFISGDQRLYEYPFPNVIDRKDPGLFKGLRIYRYTPVYLGGN